MPMHRDEVRTDRRALLLAPVIAVALAGCGSGTGAGGEDATMHLEITASDSPDVVRIDATEGASATIANSLVGDFDVEVRSVDGDDVEFSTGEDMAPEGETGGINLTDTRSDFTATKGEDVKFSTPTTDAGTTWTVTLEDGPTPS